MMPDFVINAADVDDFIETHAAHLNGEARKWACRHARRFLLRDTRQLSERPLAKGAGGDIAANHRQAHRFGLTPVWFRPTPALSDEVGRVFDWIGSLETLDPRMASKRQRISYEQARDHADAWHARLAARPGDDIQDDPDGRETVLRLADGWQWVRLISDQALDFEGSQMRHCVGDGAYDQFRTDIYSLRDPSGQPCCTVEFDPDRARVQQARARGNSDVPAKYVDRVESLLRTLRPRRMNARLTEFAINENGDILRVSRASYWPRGTRIRNHLVLSQRDDVRALPADLHINGSLILANCGLTKLPQGLTVCQALAGLSLSPVSALPEGLTVRVLNLEDSLVKSLSPGTRVLKELSLLNSPVRALPEGVSVGRLLFLDGSRIRSLPPDLKVNGIAAADWVRGDLPETVVVMGDATFAEMMFDGLDSVTVYGRLSCAGWPNTLLPECLTVYGDFEFANVAIAPASRGTRLTVHGNLDVRGTGLTHLPASWTVHGELLIGS